MDSTYKVVYQLSLSQLSSTNDHETNVKHDRYHRALVEAGMAATSMLRQNLTLAPSECVRIVDTGTQLLQEREKKL